MTGRKPLILVDCDEVLTSFLSLYRDLHSHINGKTVEHSDFKRFDFTRCVATAEEDDRIWRHLDETPGLVANMPLMDGALAALDELRSIGRVVCVTTPHVGPIFPGERLQWLVDVAGFRKADIVMCKDKSLIPGDVFIDDKVKNCESWQREHQRGRAIVFAAPHNRATNLPRANGWPQAVTLTRRWLGL